MPSAVVMKTEDQRRRRDYSNAPDMNNISKQAHENMNEAPTSSFTANLRWHGHCVCARVCVQCWHTEQAGSAGIQAAKLFHCLAI